LILFERILWSIHFAIPNTERKIAIQNVMGRMERAYCKEEEEHYLSERKEGS
jgi:hypothetical protein